MNDPMEAPPAAIMAFLREIGAAGVGHHAGRSLEEHLLATWRMLKVFGAPEPVALAGLCHSVYGTDAFDTACLGPADRPRVTAAIGEEAERLAYLFGALRREAFLADPLAPALESRFDEPPLAVTDDERGALADMLLANELDLVIAKKGAGRPDKVAKKVGPVFSTLMPFLSPGARDAYLRLAG
ncbi:MAG: DUF6817 domain-containing protein [Flavobacteriaceae bacterium]